MYRHIICMNGNIKPHTFLIIESFSKLYWSPTVGFNAIMKNDIYEASVNLITNLIIIQCKQIKKKHKCSM